MTIINPNSIAGITSVTAQADIINFYKSDGNQAGLGLNGVNFNTTAGISTFNNLVVGGTLTYEDVKNVDSVGIVTAREGIFLPDTKELKLGNTAASPDLKLYSTGTNGWVFTPISGADLYMGTNAGEVYIQTGASGNDTAIKVTSGGAVDLYYNNSKKFSTTASGVNCPGYLQVDAQAFATGGLKVNADNQKLRVGAGDDLELYHDGSNSYVNNNTGNLYLYTTTNNSITIGKSGEICIKAVPDGTVELYHNNSLKVSTTASGARVHDQLQVDGTIFAAVGLKVNVDNQKIRLGASDDLEIYHDSSHSILKNSTGYLRLMAGGSGVTISNGDNSETMAAFLKDGAVDLYHNNSKKFETTSLGISVTGQIHATSTVKVGDSVEFIAGDSNDLRLWHDGTNSYLRNTTGDLYIQGDGDDILMRAADDITLYTQTSDQAINCIGDGAVEIYHDGSKKFETKSDGATISGHLYTGTNKIITSGWGAITAPEAQGYEINSIGSPNKYMIQAKGGSSVYLYFNGDKKFETRSDGIKVTGDIQLDGANGTDLKIKTTNAAGIIYQADENGHDFQTWSNSAWRTGLHVADSGQVTKPRTPHFAANGSPSIGTNNGINYVASQFGNVPDNTGSHYSNSTGRFTAPVAGKYLFGGALWCNNGDNSSGSHLLVFKKNGSEAGFGSNHRHNGNQLHATMCIGLNANDYVTLGFADGSGGSIQGSTPRNYFWGYLVG